MPFVPVFIRWTRGWGGRSPELPCNAFHFSLSDPERGAISPQGFPSRSLLITTVDIAWLRAGLDSSFIKLQVCFNTVPGAAGKGGASVLDCGSAS